MRRLALVTAVLAFALSTSTAQAASHSRLVFAAGEETSTMYGFTTGQSVDPATYWTVRRDLSPFTPAVWRELRRRKAWITVNMRYERDFGPIPPGKPHFGELLPFLRTAKKYKVGVVAWLTVPYGDGYWATEDNVALNERMVRDFNTWSRRIRFKPKQVLLDLEASLSDTAVANNVLHNPAPVAAMLDRNVGPRHQCDAMLGYERIVAWLHDHGYTATAAAYSFLLDDIQDGNVALSDGLNMPLPRPGVFREVGFMAMSSVYQAMVGSDPGSALIASYASDIQRWYGRSGAFSLGVAGEAPYDNLGRLVTDVRLAAALTPGTIGVYSLEKTLHAFGLAGVRTLFDAADRPLRGDALTQASAPTAASRSARGYISAEDALVNAGFPLAMASRGEVALPNSWPPRCS